MQIPGDIWHSFRRGMAFAAGMAAMLALTATLAVTVETLNTFVAGDLIQASSINANFTRLETALHNVNEVPVGTISAWHRDVRDNTGADPLTLPDGWQECDGAMITDPDSPLVGFNTPDLNNQFNADANYSKGAFLRGHTLSGHTELDAFQGHTHNDSGHNHGYVGIEQAHTIRNQGLGFPWTEPNAWESRNTSTAFASLGLPVNHSYGNPRLATENRPVNFSVVYIMKIK